MTRLPSGWLRNRGSILVRGSQCCCLLQSDPIGSGAHKKPAVSSVQVFFPCRNSGLGVSITTRLYRVSRLIMHGAKHPFLPMPVWEVAQLNSETDLRSPYIFSKSRISSKTRNIFLIMGGLGVYDKMVDRGACKGIYHRVIRPLMGVDNKHIRI